MEIDLLLFDLDGTLTDSLPSAIDAIQAMVAELGRPPRSIEEINQYIGFGELPLVAGAIGSDDPALIKRARELYFKHYLAGRINTVPLYPHVKEVMKHFPDKIKIVLSNKRDEFIRLILKNHGLLDSFREILGGDTAACLKPDPCAIKALLKKYQVPPERAMIVGDMSVDIETGQNAGIHTCAVTYGFDSKAKLKKLKPDLLIDDLLALTKLVI